MPESYIIRIYRRDTLDPDTVTGLLEGTDLKEAIVFSSIGEVAEILRKAKSGAGRSKKGQHVRKEEQEGQGDVKAKK